MAGVTFVYNHDVAGVHRRINRFIEELMKSASSAGSQVTSHDQTRLDSYLNAIVTYLDWVVAQPLLDLPETHPRQWDLDTDPSVQDVENESIRDVIAMMELARDETVNGQSARMASGLIPFDENRIRAVVAKAGMFLTDYIQVTTPLDLPESSPMRSMTQPGRTGV